MKKKKVKSSNGLNLAGGVGSWNYIKDWKDIMRNWKRHALLPRNYFMLEKIKKINVFLNSLYTLNH